MSDIKIDKDVPMPKARGGSCGPKGLYPWKKMEIGNSFHVEANGRSIKQLSSMVSGSIYAAQRRTGFKFATRRDGNGIRVWRIA